MKKPVAKKPAAAKKTAAKKPAAAKTPAKKPTAAQVKGAKVAHAAHLAHVAHLAHLTHIGKAPKAAPVKRQLALGDGVACCAAEAVAASLRLSGRTVSDADVLELYRRTASDPDTGATILATLEAACEFGLAGWRPNAWSQAGAPIAQCLFDLGPRPLILGVDLPGPHAVLDDGSGWWSWGELYDPAEWPDAVIEEAWALTWN
jgi:hypothetical protein